MGLFENVYNPDVLTCLANLSNDEVFTPPEIVNQMLDMLPQELFDSRTVTFLDPVTKSGVFLREIAKRLLKSIARQNNVEKFEDIPNLQSELDRIFHTQLFGIAITEITSLLSRRSLYCSQYPNGKYSVSRFDSPQGNIRFKNIFHTWGKGERGKRSCEFCGASEVEYGEKKRKGLENHAYEFIHTNNPQEIWNMKFDVIIGNPPYQLNDGGGVGSSAIPLYHRFVLQAKKLKPRYLTMIIPARWYVGGKGLNSFRESMLTDDRLRVIHDFTNASDCFNGVEIKGGVCYFLWDRENRGLVKVYNHKKDAELSVMERPLLEKDSDIFIRNNFAIDLLKKVQSLGERSFSEIVSPRNPFQIFKFELQNKPFTNSVYCFANQKQGYITKSSIGRNKEWIPKYKVYIPKAIGIGDVETDLLKPILGNEQTCCTETYLHIGPFDTKSEAQNVISYMATKFFHLLLSLKKITQNSTGSSYWFVPMQDFKKPWSDKELYVKYGFSDDQIEFIENTVRMTENSSDKNNIEEDDNE